MESFDVIVIGGGGGAKIALPAAERGLTVAFIEKEALGGTCLNRGCIPSKMMIYPADVLYQMRNAPAVDVELSDRGRVNFRNLVQRISRTVDGMSAEQHRSLEHHPTLDLIAGEARFESNHVIRVGDRRLTAPRIFVATGSRPHIPDIPGLADVPYMTSREALRNTDLPEDMLILGGGYIACELGHAYGAFGTDTHFLVRSELLRSADIDVRREFSEVFSRHHHVHLNTQIQEVRYRDGRFRVQVCGPLDDDACWMEAEALLVATGIEPVTDTLDLENTGIQRTPEGFVRVDDCLATDVEGIYALGDCIGNYAFRHSVNFEGEYLMKTVFGESPAEPIRYSPVPHAVFTYPEVAGVGETEDSLLARGADLIVGRSSYPDSNMGLARQTDHGFVKLLFERSSRRLLGAFIVGHDASVMIHTPIAVMTMGGGLDDLLRMIYIHPALPEIIRDAARNAESRFARLEE